MGESLDATVVDTVKFVGRLTEQVDRIRATLKRRAEGFSESASSSLYASEIILEKKFALNGANLEATSTSLRPLLDSLTSVQGANIIDATLSSNLHNVVVNGGSNSAALILNVRLKDTQNISAILAALDKDVSPATCTTRMYSCVNIPVPSVLVPGGATPAAAPAPATPAPAPAAGAPTTATPNALDAPEVEVSPSSPRKVEAQQPDRPSPISASPTPTPLPGDGEVSPNRPPARPPRMGTGPTNPAVKRLAVKGGRKRRTSFSAEAGIAPSTSPGPRVVHPKSDEQRTRIAAAVKNNLMFKMLDQEQLAIVVDAMFEKTVPQGESIIKQGEDGDYFYVVDQGHFKIYVNGKEVHQERAGGSFGELALMYGAPRAATCTATQDSVLWALDRMTFTSVVVNSAHQKRQDNEAFLKGIDLCKDMDIKDVRKIADVLFSQSYEDGTVVLRQGEKPDRFYLVMEGTAKVVKNVDGETKELRRIGPGGFFGELALLNNHDRTATVVADGPSKFAFLELAAFNRLFETMSDYFSSHAQQYE